MQQQSAYTRVQTAGSVSKQCEQLIWTMDCFFCAHPAVLTEPPNQYRFSGCNFVRGNHFWAAPIYISIRNDVMAYGPFRYERVYLPLGQVADTPFHIQGDVDVDASLPLLIDHHTNTFIVAKLLDNQSCESNYQITKVNQSRL